MKVIIGKKLSFYNEKRKISVVLWNIYFTHVPCVLINLFFAEFEIRIPLHTLHSSYSRLTLPE